MEQTLPNYIFGQAQFPKQSIRGVRFTNRLEGNIGTRSASVNVAPPTALRWNFRAESKLYGRGNLWLTGICIGASQDNEGGMKIELRGPFWLLDRAGLQSLETFSMSNRENMYWLVRLCNGQMAAPPEVASDTELRAFIYTVSTERHDCQPRQITRHGRFWNRLTRVRHHICSAP